MIKKLDLVDYINKLTSLFAREKDFKIDGSIESIYKYLQKLQNKEFTPPPQVKNLDTQIIHLIKFGVLRHEDIFEFLKIVRYFLYLKSKKWSDLQEWFDKIVIPQEILNIDKHYNKNGEVIGFEEIENLNEQIKEIKQQIREKLYKYINSKKLETFLVDKNIHLYSSEDCLLVRGGFNKVINAKILGRSQSGFFYILPKEIEKLKEKEEDLIKKFYMKLQKNSLIN